MCAYKFRTSVAVSKRHSNVATGQYPSSKVFPECKPEPFASARNAVRPSAGLCQPVSRSHLGHDLPQGTVYKNWFFPPSLSKELLALFPSFSHIWNIRLVPDWSPLKSCVSPFFSPTSWHQIRIRLAFSPCFLVRRSQWSPIGPGPILRLACSQMHTIPCILLQLSPGRFFFFSSADF